MIELLIGKGADINIIDINYRHIIISFLIKRLLRRPKKLKKNNQTPLQYAVENKSKEIIELLIGKGAP